MPELPEVETIRRQLAEKIIGKKLAGRTIAGVRRRAKLLIIDLTDGSSLIFHLKLTGQLIFNGETGGHTRQVFNFDDGSKLIFNDVRKFGWWKKVKNTEEIESQFGPEALAVNPAMLKTILESRPKTRIKSLLMDQKSIAGIGNIYSDEILFAAKVNPLRRAKTLRGEEIQDIARAIKKVLAEAIRRRGTSARDYLDAFGREGGYLKRLKVYRREGESCLRRDGGVIRRLKIGGRSAHFCPVCQK